MTEDRLESRPDSTTRLHTAFERETDGRDARGW
jgi:hypothetical protein